MSLMTIGVIILLFTSIMMFTASMLSKKTNSDREKMSPFECGFDPKTKSRLPFSLQFFLIAVIFLIFDVEITLLIPMIVVMKLNSPFNLTIIMIMLMTILLLGIYHEWNQGILEWTD
uniref:NADH-ubiquinone oxidoreductase chain 3 n=1 Tax=Attagenus augustatus augustatus TaxID=2783534 RepID=A0A7S6UAY4_9COLE|nr:NADH dehydrogenase subunit 3 [Attagenus augustatus augustatus]